MITVAIRTKFTVTAGTRFLLSLQVFLFDKNVSL
jgi:hypothetical protein